MATAKTREELEVDWWKDWWAADYSWEGLRNPQKNIACKGGLHGAISLQDYWHIDPTTGEPRSDADMRAAGEFETAPDGHLWHIAHVPPDWPDGSEAKSGWSNEKRALLAAIVAARIASAQETAITLKIFERETVAGVDGRPRCKAACCSIHPRIRLAWPRRST